MMFPHLPIYCTRSSPNVEFLLILLKIQILDFHCVCIDRQREKEIFQYSRLDPKINFNLLVILIFENS